MDQNVIVMCVFGPFLSIGAAILFFIAFKFGYKYMVQQKKCTAVIQGEVRKYTLIGRGGNSCHIYPPIVYYVVNGKEYSVMGPEVKAIVSSSMTSPLGDNSQSYFIKNQVLHVCSNNNSFISFKGHIMKQLYPIGTRLPVFYCPENPKLAYVEQYCNKKFMFIMPLAAGIFCCILLVFLFVFLCL